MGQERASVAGVKANGTTPATREEAVAAGLQNAKDVGGREVGNGIVAVDTPHLDARCRSDKRGSPTVLTEAPSDNQPIVLQTPTSENF